ncbi:MAG: peptidase families S8 and S53 domain-containing protein [Parcubacteria group bacterium Gr01-1014_31]|nr:MAG: peptidase families S8 and S53 domain-containing protein [Parcubacteria group bacterium Gr01-1014_31]
MRFAGRKLAAVAGAGAIASFALTAWALPPLCPPDILTCGNPTQTTASDGDGDGVTAAQGDCDDGNPFVSPQLLERCGNAVDDNCDANIDEQSCISPSVAVITDLTAATVRAVSVDLRWTAAQFPVLPGVTYRYDLRSSATPLDAASMDSATFLSGAPSPGFPGAQETYTAIGLQPATTYYFGVRVIDAAGSVVAQSSVISTQTLPPEASTPDGQGTASDETPPASVADFYAVSGYGDITLRWTMPSDPGIVRVAIVRASGSTPSSPTDGTSVFIGLGTSTADAAVAAGTTYTYAAFTYDHAANSSASAVVSAALLPPPSDGSLVTDGSGTIFLVEGGSLLPLESTVTPEELGLSGDDILLVPASALAGFARGSVLTVRGEELLKRMDPDHDRLRNYDELQYGTDPGDPDTDYDSYDDGQEVAAGYDPLRPPTARTIDRRLVQRVAGKILLQVDRRGEAWWVHPTRGERYYLRNGKIAYAAMRYLSLGVSAADLAEIPRAGTDDRGDAALVKRLSGHILLSVDESGEAWYLNPADGHRYYLRDGDAAYWLMRYRSLGATTATLEKIPIGTLRGKLP